MSHKMYLDGQEFDLTDEQFVRIQKVCEDDAQAMLTTKKIKDLSDLNFLVRDYQRGYRWSKSEVQELLEDIHAISDEEDGYCMQPLVVKKLNENEKINVKIKLDKGELVEYPKLESMPERTYELLDGQQRLTTILLIYSILCPVDSRYHIFYEMLRGIDEYFINQASNTIKDWFSYNEDKKKSFLSKLNKLFFIWYEVTDKNVSAEKVFKSINEGKIELTNAELFKALLLNPDNVTTVEEQYKLQQIAFEWDKIENELRDDDFWYFISRDDVEKTSYGTRVDYVIEIYARQQINDNEKINLDPDKDRFSFLVIQEYLGDNPQFEDVKIVWENIVGVYDKLYSWYNDDELFHTVGFLVASEDKNRGSKAVVSDAVSRLYNSTCNMPIQDVRVAVREEIWKQIFGNNKNRDKDISVDDIKYKYQKGETKTVSNPILRKILLFTNIYAIFNFKSVQGKVNSSDTDLSREQNQSEITVIPRFPFKQYNQIKWDIEHISPQEVEGDVGDGKFEFEEFKEHIQSLADDLDENDKDKETLNKYLKQELNRNNYKSVPGYKECCDLWREYADKLSQDPDHNIGNLVLLNASINRSYRNAFFNRKRKEIIEKDRKGLFIPQCTKNVFMKYYSDSLTNPTLWTDEDKEQYKEFIAKMLEEIKRWSK